MPPVRAATYVPEKFWNRGDMTTPLARARHLSVAVAVSMLTALFSVLVTAGPSGAADPPVLIPSDRETAPVFHLSLIHI